MDRVYKVGGESRKTKDESNFPSFRVSCHDPIGEDEIQNSNFAGKIVKISSNIFISFTIVIYLLLNQSDDWMIGV